jgi:putative ABC transport system permease protein
MKKGKVLSGLLSEFSAIGLAAGFLAASGSSILAWQIALRLFDINYVFSFSLWVIGLVGGLSLVCISGYLASRRAIKSSPIRVLRNH